MTPERSTPSTLTALCALPAAPDRALRLLWISPALAALVAQQGAALATGDDLLDHLPAEDRAHLEAAITPERLTSRGAHALTFAGHPWDVELVLTDVLVLLFTPQRPAQTPHRSLRLGLPTEQAGQLAGQLLDLLPNPVFVKDRAHRWILGNRAFWELMGVSADEVLGRSDYDVFPPEQADVFWAKDEEVFQSLKNVYNEEALTGADGIPRWLLTGKMPVTLPDGSLGLVGVITDITRRKLAEEQILLNIEARDRAIEASQSKSQFLAHMSHELRTPLNAIIGYTELLLDELEDQPEQVPVRSDLQRILNAASHLLRLIDDVLDLTRIESGTIRLHLERFALRDLVRDLEETVRPSLHTPEQVLLLDLATPDATVTLDRLRLKQIVLNLLSNAIKFAPQGAITLRAALVEDDLLLEVQDQGPGIADEDLPRIFRPFERLKQHASLIAGTGLGLSLTRHLCHLMGGDVSVRSEAHTGATFIVRLPAHIEGSWVTRAAEPQRLLGQIQRRMESIHQSDGTTVLVIDDDEASYELLERFSRDLDLSFIWTNTPNRGAELAIECRPDLIVLDIFMPTRDGWSVLTELRANEATRDIPVVVLTFSDDRERADDFAHTTFLRKPISRTQWMEVVRGL